MNHLYFGIQLEHHRPAVAGRLATLSVTASVALRVLSLLSASVSSVLKLFQHLSVLSTAT